MSLINFTKFSKPAMLLLCALIVLYVTSSMYITDFPNYLIVDFLILAQVVILVNFEFYIIYNSEPNYQQLLEEEKKKEGKKR